MTSRLWTLPLIGAVGATLVTALPILRAKLAFLPIPPYNTHSGQVFDLISNQLFALLAFALIAAIVGAEDAFLGLAVLMLGVGAFLWSGVIDVTHRMMFALGALMLWAVRRVPRARRRTVVRVLAASGLFQAGYVFLQGFGLDLIWCPTLYGCAPPPPMSQEVGPILVGTLGTVDSATAYIAITAPLMPWWGLFIAIPAVVMGHSLGALFALAAGLLWRYHRNWKLTTALVVGLAAFTLYAFARIQQWHVPSTVHARYEVWRLALTDWWNAYPVVALKDAPYTPPWNPVTGNGPWFPRIVYLQNQFRVAATREGFAQAHNEWVEWCYSYGLLGAALLGGWLYTHRRMVLVPGIGAAIVAGAIAAGAFFIFQVVATALLMVTLIGLATSIETPQEVA